MLKKFIGLFEGVLGLMILSCIFFVTACGSDEPTIDKQGTPKIKISLSPLYPATHGVILQVLVTNVGEHPLFIPHLPEEALQKYMSWGGWRLTIEDQDTRMFVLGGSRPPELKKRDLIKLNPGEHLTVHLNISNAVWFPGKSNDLNLQHPRLAEANGRYDIQVFLALDGYNVPTSVRSIVWTGGVESNILEVLVLPPTTSYLPKQLQHHPEKVEDKWNCQCRADCNPAIPDNPCLQSSPDEQSHIASALGVELTEAQEKAKEKARELLGGESKPQVCFCTGPEGQPFRSYQ